MINHGIDTLDLVDSEVEEEYTFGVNEFKMNKDFVLGIPFYRFYYDESKVDFILQNLKDLQYRHNDTNWIWTGVKEDGVSGSDLYKLPQFKELFDWMSKCLDEVAKDMRLTSKLVINSAWSNLNKPGDYFYTHTHANCFVSSNYYASGSSNDKTVWMMENPYFHGTNIRPCGNSYDEEDQKTYFLVHEEATESGKFVVFPPMIAHHATPNTRNEDRLTIAANAFPTGVINAGGVSRLHVEVL